MSIASLGFFTYNYNFYRSSIFYIGSSVSYFLGPPPKNALKSIFAFGLASTVLISYDFFRIDVSPLDLSTVFSGFFSLSYVVCDFSG